MAGCAKNNICLLLRCISMLHTHLRVEVPEAHGCVSTAAGQVAAVWGEVHRQHGLCSQCRVHE